MDTYKSFQLNLSNFQLQWKKLLSILFYFSKTHTNFIYFLFTFNFFKCIFIWFFKQCELFFVFKLKYFYFKKLKITIEGLVIMFENGPKLSNFKSVHLMLGDHS